MHDRNSHLDATTLQALLDGELTRETVGSLRDHVSACVRCREQFESWQAVFDCLDRIGRAPVPFGFAERAMQRLREEGITAVPQVRVPAPQLVAADADASSHPPSDLILGLFDNVLPESDAERLRSHLAACDSCAEEGHRWSGLFTQLDGLGHVDPPRGFAASTMRRVRQSRSMGIRHRAARIARRALPATRKGWAAVAGVATAPATVAAALLWVVFSNPLVTPSALASFAGWKVGDGLGAVGSAILDLAGQSLGAFQAFQMVDLLTSSPALAGLSVLAFSALTASAAWVLYKYLFSNQRLEYARASI